MGWADGRGSLPAALRALEAKAPDVAVFKLQMHVGGGLVEEEDGDSSRRHRRCCCVV